jgi:hypothetical protein
LSSETWGRLWLLASFRSTSSAATGLERMLVPPLPPQQFLWTNACRVDLEGSRRREFS